ncbi:unnamed protein product, partial [Closterium sp. Yama58-4]
GEGKGAAGSASGGAHGRLQGRQPARLRHQVPGAPGRAQHGGGATAAVCMWVEQHGDPRQAQPRPQNRPSAQLCAVGGGPWRGGGLPAPLQDAAAPRRCCSAASTTHGHGGGAVGRQAVQWSAQVLNNPSAMLDLPGSSGVESEEDWQVPPLAAGERFSDAYDVIIFIDNRDSECHGPVFANQLSAQFGLATEVHALPAGDAMWVARHRGSGRDYVLDFIVEFTRAHDLWMAIKSSRFRDQRLRLQRCGVRRLLCLVDGSLDDLIASDPNRAAMISAEMEEGVDIQQTASLHDTKHRYLDITTALTRRYNDAAAALHHHLQQHAHAGGASPSPPPPCPLYGEFVATCRSVQSDSVSNLFGHLLLQVRSVSVDTAIAVLRRFPSLRALVNAYQLMEGNPEGQALLLTRIAVKGRRISEAVSRKVYEIVWT